MTHVYEFKWNRIYITTMSSRISEAMSRSRWIFPANFIRVQRSHLPRQEGSILQKSSWPLSANQDDVYHCTCSDASSHPCRKNNNMFFSFPPRWSSRLKRMVQPWWSNHLSKRFLFSAPVLCCPSLQWLLWNIFRIPIWRLTPNSPGQAHSTAAASPPALKCRPLSIISCVGCVCFSPRPPGPQFHYFN